jgi:hypothetical protein
MAKYSTKNDWHLVSDEEIVRTNALETDDFTVGTIKTYSGTLVDKESNKDYPGGAMKVIIDIPPAFKKSKTFKGETAWMDAERWSGDVVNDYRYGNLTQ